MGLDSGIVVVSAAFFSVVADCAGALALERAVEMVFYGRARYFPLDTLVGWIILLPP